MVLKLLQEIILYKLRINDFISSLAFPTKPKLFAIFEDWESVMPNFGSICSLKILLWETSYTLSDVIIIVDFIFFIFLTLSKTFKVPDIFVSNVFLG